MVGHLQDAASGARACNAVRAGFVHAEGQTVEQDDRHADPFEPSGPDVLRFTDS